MKKCCCLILSIFLGCFLIACNQNEYAVSNTGASACSPWMVMAKFESFNEMKEYVSLVYSDSTGEAYRQKYQWDNYDTAREVSEHLCSIPFPCVKEDAPLDNMDIRYSMRHPLEDEEGMIQWLDIIYTVNGVRYRFQTTFRENRENVSESNWILENQTIGAVEFDLYEKEDCLCGSFQMNDIIMVVTVFTTRAGNIHFDYFEFVDIPQIPESE